MILKKVKGTLIINIALLVAVLVNIPRAVVMLGQDNTGGDYFNTISFNDLLVRFFFLFIASWLVLQLNANWRYAIKVNSLIVKSVILILIHAVIFYGFVQFLIAVYPFTVGRIASKNEMVFFYIIYVVVFIILFFIAKNLRYQIIRQEDVAEKELLKQQSLKNELEALKNQINPHFLFNSLNSLNSLIRDNKPATTFVNKLSFMYRYILQSGSEDLVTLNEELKFLESYIYLIKTRYRDRFSIEIDIDNSMLTETLPALALQLLVENAVKHNEISETNPLLVKVYSKNDCVIVENVIKPRTTFVDSTGNGLVNLDKRYQMLKKKNIIISNNDQKFKVKLPVK